MHVLWRRIDVPGFDACRVRIDQRGVRLDGWSVFFDQGRCFRLTYSVTTDRWLRTRHALVRGHAGRRRVSTEIRASATGEWTLGGAPQSAVDRCIDVDLAFTPATNLLALRRLRLGRAHEAQAPAAYLDLEASQLAVLPQSYKKLSRLRYCYEAPSFGYRGTLRVSRLGVVLDYPGLFETIVSTAPAPARRFSARMRQLARSFRRFVAARFAAGSAPCTMRLA